MKKQAKKRKTQDQALRTKVYFLAAISSISALMVKSISKNVTFWLVPNTTFINSFILPSSSQKQHPGVHSMLTTEEGKILGFSRDATVITRVNFNKEISDPEKDKHVVKKTPLNIFSIEENVFMVVYQYNYSKRNVFDSERGFNSESSVVFELNTLKEVPKTQSEPRSLEFKNLGSFDTQKALNLSIDNLEILKSTSINFHDLNRNGDKLIFGSMGNLSIIKYSSAEKSLQQLYPPKDYFRSNDYRRIDRGVFQDIKIANSFLFVSKSSTEFTEFVYVTLQHHMKIEKGIIAFPKYDIYRVNITSNSEDGMNLQAKLISEKNYTFREFFRAENNGGWAHLEISDYPMSPIKNLKWTEKYTRLAVEHFIGTTENYYTRGVMLRLVEFDLEQLVWVVKAKWNSDNVRYRFEKKGRKGTDYFNKRVKPLKETNFFLVLIRENDYEHVEILTFPDVSRRDLLLYILRHNVSPTGDFGETGFSLQRMIDFHPTKFIQHHILLLDQEGFLTFFGRSKSFENVAYFGNIFKFDCFDKNAKNENDAKMLMLDSLMEASGFDLCRSVKNTQVNCLRLGKFGSTCEECPSLIDAKTKEKIEFEEIITLDDLYPLRKMCKNPLTKCEFPYHIDLQTDECYSCSTIPGCEICNKYIKRCSRCQKNHTLISKEGSCRSCSDIDNCSTCQETTYRTNDIVCLACQEGFFHKPYPKSISPQDKPKSPCRKCIPNCSKCFDNKTCEICMRKYRKMTVKEDGVKSVVCEPISCLETEYWSNEDGKCLPCANRFQPYCFKCQHFSGKCEKCFNGYKIKSESATCVQGCKEGEFYDFDPVYDRCRSCSEVNSNRMCKKCDFDTAECQACEDGYDLDQQKFCRKECSQGEFWMNQLENFCKKCSEVSDNKACLDCKNVTGICTRCQNGYFLDPEKSNFCVKQCKYLNGEYWGGQRNNVCYNCSSNCLKCSNITGICQECLDGYILQELGGEKPICIKGEKTDLLEEQRLKLKTAYFEKSTAPLS